MGSHRKSSRLTNNSWHCMLPTPGLQGVEGAVEHPTEPSCFIYVPK